ncbi:DUF1992 domain-containing protein [Mycetohabitans sp. B2]|uniref:DnaJ family domain-containing protein n=1 Tax=Mycetohabitans sp. B2 TaxID=2841274 RepID=UPI001F2E8070|nr:DUF1992 domain-containing protein [Mycetohabitans sp. B2]MCF7696038.1 DUF1992 domain-containing protein [Mycetohabitans sp. B2]
MKLLDALVEQRIAAAAARSEFDDLPGSGRALQLDDDLLVPHEVRVANRILKNAGFVPPGVEHLRALRELEHALCECDMGPQCPAHDGPLLDRAEQRRLRAKWLALTMALESLRGGPMVVPHEYCRRVAERLAGCGGAVVPAATD